MTRQPVPETLHPMFTRRARFSTNLVYPKEILSHRDCSPDECVGVHTGRGPFQEDLWILRQRAREDYLAACRTLDNLIQHLLQQYAATVVTEFLCLIDENKVHRELGLILEEQMQPLLRKDEDLASRSADLIVPWKGPDPGDVT